MTPGQINTMLAEIDTSIRTMISNNSPPTEANENKATTILKENILGVIRAHFSPQLTRQTLGAAFDNMGGIAPAINTPIIYLADPQLASQTLKKSNLSENTHPNLWDFLRDYIAVTILLHLSNQPGEQHLHNAQVLLKNILQKLELYAARRSAGPGQTSSMDFKVVGGFFFLIAAYDLLLICKLDRTRANETPLSCMKAAFVLLVFAGLIMLFPNEALSVIRKLGRFFDNLRASMHSGAPAANAVVQEQKREAKDDRPLTDLEREWEVSKAGISATLSNLEGIPDMDNAASAEGRRRVYQ